MGCFPINIASGNNFELSFPKLPFSSTLNDSKKLTLHLYNTILPGCSIDVNSQQWQGHITKRIDSNLNYNDLNVSFDVDEEFVNWQLIYGWLKEIDNNKDSMKNVVSDYAVDVSLTIYNNYHQRLMSIKYIRMFPISLDDVSLSYREGETYLEGNASFSYDRFEIIS